MFWEKNMYLFILAIYFVWNFVYCSFLKYIRRKSHFLFKQSYTHIHKHTQVKKQVNAETFMEDVRTVVNTVQIKMVTYTIRPLFKYKFL